MCCNRLSKVFLLLLSIGAYWGLLGSVCSGNDIIAKGGDSGYSAEFQRKKKKKQQFKIFLHIMALQPAFGRVPGFAFRTAENLLSFAGLLEERTLKKTQEIYLVIFIYDKLNSRNMFK